MSTRLDAYRNVSTAVYLLDYTYSRTPPSNICLPLDYTYSCIQASLTPPSNVLPLRWQVFIHRRLLHNGQPVGPIKLNTLPR